jgi:FPC/CPF motif-containing protein YcgG
MYEQAEILLFSDDDWRKKAFLSFHADMTQENPRFPCVFGTKGLKQNQLRFGFFDDAEEESVVKLAQSLKVYLPIAKTLGNYTSFVTFFRMDESRSLTEYEDLFWSILNRLHHMDSRNWPEGVSKDPDDPTWEFSFMGEPIFVVCNTPAHQLRNSRYASTFMITFQPRWVFDAIGLQTPQGAKAKKLVRTLLKEYDEVAEFPHLGVYGEAGTKEWLQYFIPDTNTVDSDRQCPFHTMRGEPMLKARKVSGESVTLSDAVLELLPTTGSVEVQRDTPRREHKPHQHPTDETLLIVEGEITFFVDGEAISCHSGDRVLLPKNTPHSSVAGEQGCLYVIALEFVEQQRPQEEVVQ